MAVNSRAKGARGEREWRDFLRQHGFDARRGQQFAGGADSPDVISNVPGVHWEVKRVERFNLYPALAQADGDRADGNIPVVAHRANGKRWVVVLKAEDFLDMVARIAEKNAQSEGNSD